jgi:hypothetical protein
MYTMSDKQLKKGTFVFVIAAIVILLFTVSGLWFYGRSTSVIKLPAELSGTLRSWWQDYKGSLYIQTHSSNYPWYFILGNPHHSTVDIKPLSFEIDGLKPGNSLFLNKNENTLYVMDPYVFFVPYGDTSQPTTPLNSNKIKKWLTSLYPTGQFTILLKGNDDNDLFAFLSVLYAGLTDGSGTSLPNLFIEAQEKKDFSIVGFSTEQENTFDINGLFFTKGAGKILLDALKTLQIEGYLPSAWQYYSQEDMENQMSLVKGPMVLFGPYSYKKEIYATKLLAWRAKRIDTTLMPLHLLQVSLPKKNTRKVDTELFTALVSKDSLRTLNEKTPYLSISFDVPQLNKDHRMLIEELNKSIVVPCNLTMQNDKSLIRVWLENWRDLIKKSSK